MTLVSVCIRTHDRPEGLRRAVSSVLAQSYGGFEIIVSDDTGTAEEVSREFGGARVRYLRSADRGGPAANLRSALRAARGQLLALLDDDCWHEHFLSNALAPFEHDPDLGVVFSSYYVVAGPGRFRRELPIAPGRHDWFMAEILDKWPVAPSAAFGDLPYILPDDERSLSLVRTLALRDWDIDLLREPNVPSAILDRVRRGRDLDVMIERARPTWDALERTTREAVATFVAEVQDYAAP